MNKIIVLVMALAMTTGSQGQKYFTKNGRISFDATAPSSPEKVVAVNRSVTVVMDIKSGAVQLVTLMKGFEFEKALMQEHFNENYIESDQFPKAEFKGKIENAGEFDFTKEGVYKVKVKGDLTIHGETNGVETEGKVTVTKDKINTEAEFSIKLPDYKISIPGLVADKVSKIVKITVSCPLELFKN